MLIQNRRSFLRIGASGLFGAHAAFLGLSKNASAATFEPGAQNVILIWLDGAPSSIDMWDLKPNAPDTVRGEFKAVSTDVPGIQICEHLTKMRQLMSHCTLIRSLQHSIPEHGPASQLMLTGHLPSASEQYPALGSVTMKMLSPKSPIPQNIAFDSPSANTSGYLGSAYNPFLLNNMASIPVGLSLGLETDRDLFDQRIQLRDRFEQAYDHLGNDGTVVSLKQLHKEAKEILMSDSIRKALDISKETESTRNRYGAQSSFGTNVLRARRLVEAGTRFVTVGLSGWDTHTNNFSQLKNGLLPQLDAALSSLLSDLVERDMLSSTIVCCVGEFGRTPNINGNVGRDHWSRSFSALVAGGGFAAGAVYGETDEFGQEPLTNLCTPSDLFATVLHLVGIQSNESIKLPSGRLMKINEQGNVIAGALA